jgi:hypothetical protein
MPGDSGSTGAKTSSGLRVNFSRRMTRAIGNGNYLKGRQLINQASGDTKRVLRMQQAAAKTAKNYD